MSAIGDKISEVDSGGIVKRGVVVRDDIAVTRL